MLDRGLGKNGSSTEPLPFPSTDDRVTPCPVAATLRGSRIQVKVRLPARQDGTFENAFAAVQ